MYQETCLHKCLISLPYMYIMVELLVVSWIRLVLLENKPDGQSHKAVYHLFNRNRQHGCFNCKSA